MPAAAAKGNPRRGRKGGARHVSRPWDNLARGRPSARAGALQQTRGVHDPQRNVIIGRPLRPVQESAAPGDKLPHERFTPLLRTAYGDPARHERENYDREEPEGSEDEDGGEDDVNDEGDDGSDERESDSCEDEDTDSEEDDDDRDNDNSDGYEEPVVGVQTRQPYGSRSIRNSLHGDDETPTRHAQGDLSIFIDPTPQKDRGISAIGPFPRPRRDIYENPDKIRIGHRSIKPLNVRALPPTPLAGLLPIPNLPPTPISTAYRHSIRPPCPSDNPEDSELDDERNGPTSDQHVDDKCDGGSSDDDDDNSACHCEPRNHCDRQNQPPYIPTTSMDSPTPSPSLDGFGRSARTSILRHSFAENPALRRSRGGAPVNQSSNLEDQYFKECIEQCTPSVPVRHPDVHARYASLQDFVDFDKDSWANHRNIDPGSDFEAELERRSAEFSDADSTSTFASDVSPSKSNQHVTPKDIEDRPVSNGAFAQQRSKSESSPTRVNLTSTNEHTVHHKNDGSSRRMNDLKLSRMNDDDVDDDDYGVFDAPASIAAFPGLEPAMRDLQRASVKAGHELAAVAFGASTAQRHSASTAERVSRAQGELLLRSRFLRRWNSRFASVVDHAYFGSVLFLFCMDAKATKPGGLVLKNSKMIVLADAHVQRVDGHRKLTASYLLELKTAQRSYLFACENERQRRYWLDNFTAG
jgi:hypothetical protein